MPNIDRPQLELCCLAIVASSYFPTHSTSASSLTLLPRINLSSSSRRELTRSPCFCASGAAPVSSLERMTLTASKSGVQLGGPRQPVRLLPVSGYRPRAGSRRPAAAAPSDCPIVPEPDKPKTFLFDCRHRNSSVNDSAPSIVKGATAMPAGQKLIEFNKRLGSGAPTIPSLIIVS